MGLFGLLGDDDKDNDQAAEKERKEKERKKKRDFDIAFERTEAAAHLEKGNIANFNAITAKRAAREKQESELRRRVDPKGFRLDQDRRGLKAALERGDIEGFNNINRTRLLDERNAEISKKRAQQAVAATPAGKRAELVKQAEAKLAKAQRIARFNILQDMDQRRRQARAQEQERVPSEWESALGFLGVSASGSSESQHPLLRPRKERIE